MKGEIFMDDKNNKTPLELPDNNPESETKPIRSNTRNVSGKNTVKSRTIKIAYAFALLLAFGGALIAKIATEKNLGNLNVPIEQDYITIAPTTQKESQPDFEVRQNMTDVPDTREETEAVTKEQTTVITTQKSIYAEPYKDYYTLPLSTQISKEYKPDTPSYNTTTDDWRTHAAIDFEGIEGAQIKSISTGTVKEIYDDALLGTVITIDHGNEVTAKYCGINKETLEVNEGDSVSEGQCVGYLGKIPYEKSEVPHLHFEMYYKGKNVDPLELMGK